jgi:hypothetical protein
MGPLFWPPVGLTALVSTGSQAGPLLVSAVAVPANQLPRRWVAVVLTVTVVSGAAEPRTGRLFGVGDGGVLVEGVGGVFLEHHRRDAYATLGAVADVVIGVGLLEAGVGLGCGVFPDG